MKSIVKKTILAVKPYVPGKPIEEVKRELRLRDVIKLASNENPYSPSPKVLKAITQASKELNRYPDGDCHYLRKALAGKLNVSGKQLIFGNGSDELIVLAVRAFAGKGDEVVIAKPSFLIYSIVSAIAGAKVKAVPLKDFRYDLDAMKKAVTRKTKIIFLGNPDNPSGMYFTEKEIRSFLKGLRRNILVFIDEAYYEYVNARDYVDSLKLLRSYKNVIVTRTFSKMYGLAGLRIGYGIANAQLIDLLNRIREPFNVNSLAQVAAMVVLKDRAYYRGLAKKVNVQRKYLHESFKKLNLDFVASRTNFILVKTNDHSGNVAKKLLKKGIIVRDMSVWGLRRFIRVTIGSAQENKRLIKTLKEIL
ncbi:MAG: histidinol-phosphate transaminase [Candidatus Omnitrophica bacterium]|nr:histidinol-phosphate transaminase [Candidatus Omnitrophota bacterium]